MMKELKGSVNLVLIFPNRSKCIMRQDLYGNKKRSSCHLLFRHPRGKYEFDLVKFKLKTGRFSQIITSCQVKILAFTPKNTGGINQYHPKCIVDHVTTL